MKTQTISTVMAVAILLAGCGKKSAPPGTSPAPGKEQANAASTATAANLSGTWKWMAPANPDGKIPNITFTLNLQGETLTGTVNKLTGSVATTKDAAKGYQVSFQNISSEAITNGAVKGDEVSFQTIRAGKAGKTTTTYSGKISGDTIKGTVEIEVGDRRFGPQDWEADRVKE